MSNPTPLLAFLITCAVLAVSPAAPAEELDIGDRACLFLDDTFIAELQGLTRTWHQGIPRAEPAIVVDKPWEQWPHAFGSALYDPRERLYKMWYEGLHQGVGLVCYAESQDGITWSKPGLGHFEVAGTRDNNVVYYPAELPNVFLDPQEHDPQARFKCIAWCRNNTFKEQEIGGLYLFSSADGRDWNPIGSINGPQPSDDTGNSRTVLDTNQIIWDERGQRYYGTFRSFPSHPGLPGFTRNDKYETTYGVTGGHRRAVAVATSDSIRSGWKNSVTVLRADARDDEKAQRLSQDPDKADYVELYIMPPFLHGNHYLGVVSLLFFVDHSDTAIGGGDLQLCFSHDGLDWQRQPDRQTLIAASPSGRVPCYTMCNAPLHIGDHWWLYYTEADSAHPAQDHQAAIRAAIFRAEGFASLDAGDHATLATRPLNFHGSRLVLNAQTAADGHIRVGLFDTKGKALPGFDLADSDPLRGDHTQGLLTWRGQSDVSALRGRPVVLKMELSRASLFSLRADRN